MEKQVRNYPEQWYKYYDFWRKMEITYHFFHNLIFSTFSVNDCLVMKQGNIKSAVLFTINSKCPFRGVS